MSEQRNYMAEVQALIDEKFKDNPEGLRIAMEEAERERAKRIQVAKSENYLEKAKKEKELKKQEMKERLETMNEELSILKSDWDVINDEVTELFNKKENFELDPDNYRDSYDELLNEDGEVKIGGISFDRAYILKELDEIAYEQGLSEYVDSIDIEDDYTYGTIVEELEEKENEAIDIQLKIEELENEIEELETEIEELEEEEEEEEEDEE
jgi:predicted  nucleic acid-binding Zn-ribbon protein